MEDDLKIEEIYSRTETLIGKEAIQKLKKTKICICGIGGVGSYALEALARIGIGNIVIVDKDKVDMSNINRQLIATLDSLGKPKVEVAEKRIKQINPTINVMAYEVFIDENNIDKIIDSSFDYVIDAIDSVDSKVQLIKYCYENNIKIISSMGMANRLNPLDIKVSDIHKTSMCPLAKVIRKRLKDMNIKRLKVVYSIEQPKKIHDRKLGSVSFVPATAGLLIASEIIKDIVGGE